MHALATLDASGWFDYWHVHPDWKGRGARSENRDGSVRLALKLLKTAEQIACTNSQPAQAWLAIGPQAAGDAVYVHSANPNGSPFPHAFDGVDWEIEIPPWLGVVLDRHTYAAGGVSYEEGLVFIVVRRDFLARFGQL